MRWGHVGAALFQRVMQLAQHILVVLTGQPRHQRDAIAFTIGAMATGTITAVQTCTGFHLPAVARAGARAITALRCNIGGYIGNVPRAA